MKQLSFDFHRELRIGDEVKIVSKSCGGSFCPCKRGRIHLISIFPDGWVERCRYRRPPVGTTFYQVDGNYFLRKDLKLLRRGR